MEISLRSAALVLALCLSVFILGPTPAQAIPVAGDYVLTGSSNFVGSFTSDGSQLTAWNISYNPLSVTWNTLDACFGTSGDCVQTNTNFFFNTYSTAFDNLYIDWANESCIGGTCITTDRYSADNQYVTESLAYAPAAVSVPGTFWPFALGFLALVGYDWRQRRQAGMWVG